MGRSWETNGRSVGNQWVSHGESHVASWGGLRNQCETSERLRGLPTGIIFSSLSGDGNICTNRHTITARTGGYHKESYASHMHVETG